jgi:hypothetical protein
MIRRRHPGGDLGSRAKAELVQDAADVAVDGALGYEQARSDLLVGQAVGDQVTRFPSETRSCCGG